MRRGGKWGSGVCLHVSLTARADLLRHVLLQCSTRSTGCFQIRVSWHILLLQQSDVEQQHTPAFELSLPLFVTVGRRPAGSRTRTDEAMGCELTVQPKGSSCWQVPFCTQINCCAKQELSNAKATKPSSFQRHLQHCWQSAAVCDDPLALLAMWSTSFADPVPRMAVDLALGRFT